MSTTPASVSDMKAFAPEFACESTIRLGVSLNIAAEMLSVGACGDIYHDAQLLLACHVLTLMNRRGAGGQLTMEKAGDLTVQFQSVSKFPKYWDLTSYGQLCKQLLDTRFCWFTVTQPQIQPQTSDDQNIFGGSLFFGPV